jgi:hypothetical protein
MATYTDNFNRADSNPISGNWATPVGVASAVQLVSHTAEPTSSLGSRSASYSTVITWPADHFSEVTLAALNNGYLGPCVRLGPGTGYGIFASGPTGSSNSVYLQEVGGGTTFAIFTMTPQIGDVLRLEVLGSTLTFKQNGTVIGSVSDSTYTLGNPGMAFLPNAVPLPAISFWTGGFGSPTPLNYSQPDCRVAPFGPNASRNVQGTLTYDVQISDNAAVPGKDSRVSKPVDCRVAPNIPQNSRAPGTFGPGE